MKLLIPILATFLCLNALANTEDEFNELAKNEEKADISKVALNFASEQGVDITNAKLEKTDEDNFTECTSTTGNYVLPIFNTQFSMTDPCGYKLEGVRTTFMIDTTNYICKVIVQTNVSGLDGNATIASGQSEVKDDSGSACLKKN